MLSTWRKTCLLGFENNEYVGTAIIGAKKGHWFLREMLDFYDSHPFLLSKGKYYMIPNTEIMTDLLIKHGYKRGCSMDVDGVFVGDRKLFYGNGKDVAAVGIHYFRGSWWCEKERARSKSKTYKAIKPFLVKGKKVLACMIGAERAREIEGQLKNLIK